MNIWEEVYYRHREGGSAPVNPQMDENQYQQQNHRVLSESVNHPPQPASPGSLEEAYYQNNKPQPACHGSLEEAYYQNSKPQPVKQYVQDQESQTQAPTKPVKARFIPRIQSA